jgi:F0F1-type ATP synthase epsilon subunit
MQIAVENTKKKNIKETSMTQEFSVMILSKTEPVYKCYAQAVSLPSVKGQLTILRDHMPIITKLSPGTVDIIFESGDESKKKTIAVQDGFVEMNNNVCNLFL